MSENQSFSQSSLPQYRPYNRKDDEISLLDLAVTLAKHKKLILGLPVLTAVLVGLATLFIPNIYTAKTRILPVGGKDVSTELYVLLLKSRPVADSLAKRLKLQAAYGTSSADAASEQLIASSNIALAKDGTIEVSVNDRSAKMAAAIANGYPEQLQQMEGLFAVTEASKQRLSLEKQLSKSQQDLAGAELALARLKQVHPQTALDPQIESYVKSTTGLKSQIAMKEVELAAMRNGDDPIRNPQYIRIQQEMSAFWAELGKVENGSLLTARVTSEELDYLHKVRDQVYAETRYTELKKQLELAKLEELHDTPVFQVIERAAVPNGTSSPDRYKIILISALSAAFLAVLWAFMSEAVQSMKTDPDSSSQYQALLSQLKW